MGSTKARLLESVKDGFFQSLFMKPLRALPTTIQIAHISALTYCMRLEEKVVPSEDFFHKMIQDAHTLMEMEDDKLIPAAAEYRNAQLIVQLRCACLEMLTTAMAGCFVDQTAPIWGKILMVLFNGIYAKSSEVIDCAYQCLKKIITVYPRLPKDILQTGLRPVLTSLQQPGKLTVESLESLARLLKLLTTYFKAEIGQRLLEHAKRYMDPANIQKASYTLLDSQRSVKILAGIINVYHLLPTRACGKFMPDLVDLVLDLETNLRRTRTSPFREPLVRFMNTYPNEALEFFLIHMDNFKQG